MSSYHEIITAFPDDQGYGFINIRGINLYRLKHAGRNTWFGVEVFQNDSDFKVKAVIGHIKSVDTKYGTQELKIIISDPDKNPVDVSNISKSLKNVEERAKQFITR